MQHVLLSPPYRITESTKDLAISYWLLSTKDQHDHRDVFNKPIIAHFLLQSTYIVIIIQNTRMGAWRYEIYYLSKETVNIKNK